MGWGGGEPVIDAEVNYQSWERRIFLGRANRTLSFWLLPVFSTPFLQSHVLMCTHHQSRHTYGPIQQSFGLVFDLGACIHTGFVVMGITNPGPLKRGCLA